MTEFLAMGGYAKWVWSAYGFTVVIFLANVISARRRLRQTVAELRMMDADGHRSIKV